MPAMWAASFSYYRAHKNKHRPGTSTTNPKCYRHGTGSGCDLDLLHVIPNRANKLNKSAARDTASRAHDNNANKSSRYIDTNMGPISHNTG